MLNHTNLNDKKLDYFSQEVYNNLLHKFPGAENIEKNFSASWHDMFILSALDGKTNGTFIEIGGDHPTFINNTWILENQFGWRGISFDIDSGKVDRYNSVRPGVCYCMDATTCDILKLVKENNLGTHIDYLQLDIEPAHQTLRALENIPFSELSFSIIHFEHDYYANHQNFSGHAINPYNNSIGQDVPKRAEEILTSFGYKLAIRNLGVYEDWYYNPETVDPEIISKLIKPDLGYNLDNFYWGHESVTDLPHDVTTIVL